MQVLSLRFKYVKVNDYNLLVRYVRQRAGADETVAWSTTRGVAMITRDTLLTVITHRVVGTFLIEAKIL